jgi:hypothetical protein
LLAALVVVTVRQVGVVVLAATALLSQERVLVEALLPNLLSRF